MSKWLREYQVTLGVFELGFLPYVKALAIFLRYCLGWTASGSVTTNSGTGDTLTFSTPNVTLDDSGANFTTALVGQNITISGATNPGNNGTFPITAVNSRTQLVFTNAGGVNESSSFSWSINNTMNWYSVEKTGTNGEFNLTGTDSQFRDTTAASFVAGDVGKTICIAGNDRNAGVYTITGYTSATTITVSFICAATEYPDQETGLSWYLWARNYEIPYGGYTRLATGYTIPWGIEVGVGSDGTGQYINLDIVPNVADWTTKLALSGIMRIDWGETGGWCYANADEDYLNVLAHLTSDDAHEHLYAGVLDSPENRPNLELVVGGGGVEPVRNQNAYSWSQRTGGVITSNMMEPSYGVYTAGLSRWTSRERNARASGANAGGGTGDSISMAGSVATLTDTGATFVASDVGKTIRVSNCTNAGNNGIFTVTAYLSATQVQYTNASGVNETSSFTWSMDKQDLYNGSLIMHDANNTAAEYTIVGRIRGHYSTRSTLSHRQAFDHAGFLDRFHWGDGISLTWPGVTPQH